MKRYYAYEDFTIDTKTLIQKVKKFRPDAILAIARGGYMLSCAMAEGLSIRDLQSIRTELYDKEHKRNEITLVGEPVFCKEQRVLVVDDIADSGETLCFVMHHLQKKFQKTTFASATLFYKKTSIYEPDFWVNEADIWIEFFWEKDFLV